MSRGRCRSDLPGCESTWCLRPMLSGTSSATRHPRALSTTSSALRCPASDIDVWYGEPTYRIARPLAAGSGTECGLW
jgi:hypothetical protein